MWWSSIYYTLHTNGECGKKEAHINWFMVTFKKEAPVVTRTTLRKQKSPRVSTRLSLDVENERADARLDGEKRTKEKRLAAHPSLHPLQCSFGEK